MAIEIVERSIPVISLKGTYSDLRLQNRTDFQDWPYITGRKISSSGAMISRLRLLLQPGS